VKIGIALNNIWIKKIRTNPMLDFHIHQPWSYCFAGLRARRPTWPSCEKCPVEFEDTSCPLWKFLLPDNVKIVFLSSAVATSSITGSFLLFKKKISTFLLQKFHLSTDLKDITPTNWRQFAKPFPNLFAFLFASWPLGPRCVNCVYIYFEWVQCKIIIFIIIKSAMRSH